MNMTDTHTSESSVKKFLAHLSSAAKWSLGIGAVLCFCAAAVVLWWAMRADYQVLFSNLEASDASAVVQELKRQKIVYRLEDGGRTISVPADQVYETRLSLMTDGVSLSGGVGFEIFDRQSMGATEQSQRVAYQRALQGELARTIGALEHVRQARVLLVLPESTLFKRDQQQPRAAVSLVLDPGAQLSSEQIAGVQRLVAASVAGMDVDQVVILDQRGVTLSAPDASSMTAAATGTRLKLKTELEVYFAKKIYAMLERVIGTGKAIVTVDATLNFDQITRTLQTVVPLDNSDVVKNGGVLRRRETRTRGGAGEEVIATSGGGNDATSLDIEYEFGKRLEQVAAAPGALTRLSVSLIVPGVMTVEREARLQQLVRAAAGVDSSRGDTVVVDSLERIADPQNAAANKQAGVSQDGVTSMPVEGTINTLEDKKLPNRITTSSFVIVLASAILLLLSLVVYLLWQRRGTLSDSAREALLADIVSTLDGTHGEPVRRI